MKLRFCIIAVAISFTGLRASAADAPAEFGAYQKVEMAKWSKLIREARIAVD